ncbi:hypothetical protein MA20_01695 [Bradyrhizobium japonicum]|uniref:Uncharacterized protein n=1 Tax=Bradyrhizobium japonicum TaxID=375 RepID=A0A0A3Y816_BRAJP|nr:hypothetical protein MA20_01695 [Bradyrhizobium japonicum]
MCELIIAAEYWMPRSRLRQGYAGPQARSAAEASAKAASRGMIAEIEAAVMPDQGAPHQIATLVRDLAEPPLQSGSGTSIKRTSFIRAGERFA